VEADLFKVRWTQPAEEDLEKIIDEIAEDAPLRAVDFGRRVWIQAVRFPYQQYRPSRYN
jgi:plasmid stabilization system protein ParE